MSSSEDLISREGEKDPMTVHHTLICACILENTIKLHTINEIYPI